MSSELLQPAHPPQRHPRSLKQQYQEFILQRIEEYKDGLSREDLLKIGDEAVQELESNAVDQYVLTEVLLLEHVDRIITRRLKLPSYRRWRSRHMTLRAAQREPTHWGLDLEPALIARIRRLGPEAGVVVIGSGRCDVALFVAAHDALVTLLDHDLAAIEMAESRATTEQLASRFEAYVVAGGNWLPACTPALVLCDVAALGAFQAGARETLLRRLKDATQTGGAHVFLPTAGKLRGAIPLAPEALQPHYHDWIVERSVRGGRRAAGFTATKPPRQEDTPAASK